MKLDADKGHRTMANGHDFLFALRRVTPRRDFKLRRQRGRINQQAVITRGDHGIGDVVEDSLPVVLNVVGLAVHQPFGANNGHAESLPDRLVPQANAQQRQFSGEVLYAFDRNPGLGGSARAGGDDQVRGTQILNLGGRDLIIAKTRISNLASNSPIRCTRL